MFVTFSYASANNLKKTENSTTDVTTTVVSGDDETKAVHLTTDVFKVKVFNYEKNKEWKYEGDLPCIIDFYTDWCGPCKRIAPILEELAKEYDGKIIVYKINTEKEPELAQAFGVRSIPTLLFVPMKGKPQMAKGALPKEQLKEAINDVLLVK